MPLSTLSARDQATVHSCLEYVLRSGQLEGEFHTRMGVTELEVEGLLTQWPAVDDAADDSDACIAINNALNEVCHMLSVSQHEWARWFTASRDEIRDVYQRWAKSRGWHATGIR